ncbi:MAG: 6-phosphofructokinase [Candidatus Bipolaricaulota bacterium]|nr:6-phosphofructokinase [Candidatus Bipolaricaulota bacterium]
MSKKIAVFTGGGHIGGFNSGLSGIWERGEQLGWDIYGAIDGWSGLARVKFVNLSGEEVANYAGKGGSILGSSRYKPGLEELKSAVSEYDIDGVVALGGDDTLGILARLWEEADVPAVGWPKTMDNDLSGTYFTIGYPTAVDQAGRLVRESADMAYTHGRVMINTLFGRGTDWMAAGACAFGDADLVVPGEETVSINEIYKEVKKIYLENREKYGKGFAVVVAAEGASIKGLSSHRMESEEFDEFGHVKLSPKLLALSLSEAIQDISKEEFGERFSTAHQALTYLLRNGPANEVDKEMGYKAGCHCVELLNKNKPGKMASIQHERGSGLTIDSVKLTKAAKQRDVKGSGYIDYSDFCVTDAYLEYSRPFMGEKRNKEINLLGREKVIQ